MVETALAEKKTRIIDVARMSDVSTATVSHVINNTRFVSEEVRKRVLYAIKKLHYYPSDIARSLSTKKTKTVGVIISDIQNPFYGILIRGIEEVLHEFDYNILLASNDENALKDDAHLKTFFSRGIDGLILTPALENISFLEVMESVGIKIVIIDRALQKNPFTSVVVDNRIGSQNLISHLISDGHKKIGTILGVSRSTINERFNGYKDALMENGIPFREVLVTGGWSQQRGGYEAAKELFRQDPGITAIFATNNLMTLGALFAIREMGMKCPDEVALVGFDDTSWAPIFHPPLTMVSQPIKEIGIMAANLLLKQIDGEITPQTVELKTTLIIRGSCSIECLRKYQIRQEVDKFREYPFH